MIATGWLRAEARAVTGRNGRGFGAGSPDTMNPSRRSTTVAVAGCVEPSACLGRLGRRKGDPRPPGSRPPAILGTAKEVALAISDRECPQCPELGRGLDPFGNQPKLALHRTPGPAAQPGTAPVHHAGRSGVPRTLDHPGVGPPTPGHDSLTVGRGRPPARPPGQTSSSGGFPAIPRGMSSRPFRSGRLHGGRVRC